MNPQNRWKYILAIAVPLLLATLGVVAVTFDLLARVSTGANQADHDRTRQTVFSALDATKRQLANVVTDNAYWDDAARNIYGDFSVDWFDETFADSTADALNYDAVYVVDLQGGVLAGFRHGLAFKPEVDAYFGGRLTQLLATFAPIVVKQSPRATLAMTGDGLAVIAAAPVAPTSPNLDVQLQRPRFLVMTRFFTPQFLSSLSNQYVVPGLALYPADTQSRGLVDVTDFRGEAVARATWTVSRPGDLAAEAVTTKMLGALALLATVMLGFGVWCWLLVHRLARNERRARRAALQDSLTGLPNRAALSEELDARLNKQQRFAVAFIDLDGFKEVNDNYDHNVGDQLICAVARGLVYLAEDQAAIFRLGGDEFVALFSGNDAEDAAHSFAAMLNDFLAMPFEFEDRLASVSASVGIAVCDRSITDASEIMRRADIAMYRAKHDGRGRARAYSPEYDAERLADLAVAHMLSDILANEGLDVVYQPIFNAHTLQIVGVEALARWPAKRGARVSPERFVRVAENSGLIDTLGDAILTRACAEARRWPGLSVAINISVAQLRNPRFAERALNIIHAAGISPDRIELEMTESQLIEDATRIRSTFTKLRRAGVKIALDDFGAGYASIGYLRQFEFDRVKIDKSLVSRVFDGEKQMKLVQGTVLMAVGLSACVTAEGVETARQVEALRNAGCSEMQGFYLGAPMSVDDIGERLAAQVSVVAA